MQTDLSVVMMQAGGGGMGVLGFLPLILLAVVFYFMMASQNKRQKKWQEVLANLKNGDKVVTKGGLRGTIISVKDDCIQLRIPPDNLRLEVMRGFIESIVTSD